MSKKNIGSNLDEFLSKHTILDEANAVAVNRVSAWQFEQELKARRAEVDGSQVESIPVAEVFAGIRRKL